MQDEARVQRRNHATFAHLKNPAKNLENFRNFGALRALKLRAVGHRALHMLHKVIES